MQIANIATKVNFIKLTRYKKYKAGGAVIRD